MTMCAGGGRMKADPNFPSGLAIRPSSNARTAVKASVSVGTADPVDAHHAAWDADTAADIEQWGIAGRIWEAAYILRQYLQSPHASAFEFDPPCSLFATGQDSDQSICALELGSGVGYVGIHFALALESQAADGDASDKDKHTVIFTDLENVCPLIERNAARAFDAGMRGKEDAQEATSKSTRSSQASPQRVDLLVRPLPWGDAAAAERIMAQEGRAPTHIICSDLVYFPELLPPLLRTLLQLTARRAAADSSDPAVDTEVIIAYKVRSLPKEQPFWQALGAWFDMVPVQCRRRLRRADGQEHVVTGKWHRFGAWASDLDGDAAPGAPDATVAEEEDDTPAEDDYFIFSCRRRADSHAYAAPADDAALMDGRRVRLRTRNGAGGAAPAMADGQPGEEDEPEEPVSAAAAGDAFELLLLGALEV